MHVLTLMMTAGNLFEMFFNNSSDAHAELEKTEGTGEFNLHDDYGSRFVGEKSLIAVRMVVDLEKKFTASTKCEMLKMNAQRMMQAQMAAKPPLALAHPNMNGTA